MLVLLSFPRLSLCSGLCCQICRFFRSGPHFDPFSPRHYPVLAVRIQEGVDLLGCHPVSTSDFASSSYPPPWQTLQKHLTRFTNRLLLPSRYGYGYVHVRPSFRPHNEPSYSSLSRTSHTNGHTGNLKWACNRWSSLLNYKL